MEFKKLFPTALIALLFFSLFFNHTSYAEENTKEEFSVAAFEQLTEEVEQGIITNEEQADKRFKELIAMYPESEQNDSVRYAYHKVTPLFLAAESQSCLKKIGSFNCAKVKIDADAAMSMARAYYPYSLDEGIGDAFRHSYWNARMCKNIGCGNAKIIADDHEKFNPTSKVIHDMDYYNNQKGRDMYNYRKNNGYSMDYQGMANHLRADISRGYLKYIKKPEWWLLWTNQ
ncbi:hypothetical protein H9I32_08555 [Bacillus sp. Xin]|uniref:DUF6973 domain-containing protein n=1 Tax=unclassified Bacillus (in: firmicutes) TaxID=185979 RepID=UPI001572869C|nr:MULTISPECIES: hypothetical protein [unclassified Bacillus (in: firmicutes)]MBC6972457.1 hypothetical protein [Bacillus sp. Xin]NSW39608.1 hypothetical protein [Bacillus sp. Xin1]